MACSFLMWSLASLRVCQHSFKTVIKLQHSLSNAIQIIIPGYQIIPFQTILIPVENNSQLESHDNVSEHKPTSSRHR